MRVNGLNWLRNRRRTAVLALAALVVVGVPVGIACVSDGPGPRLMSGDALILSLPQPRFASVLEELQGLDPHAIADLPVIDYAYSIEGTDEASDFQSAWRDSGGDPLVLVQFEIYREAEEALERREPAVARAAALRILELPPEMRRWRSVDAAFLLGRVTEEHHGECIYWMNAVRSLVAEGCRDTSGRACASLGWEARAELADCNPVRALRLYLAQHLLSKGQDITAAQSISIVCSGLSQATDDELVACASDPVAAPLVTAWMASCYRSTRDSWYDIDYGSSRNHPTLERWQAMLERCEVADLAFAPTMAYAAYVHGRFDVAERWCALSPKDHPGAGWVRSKLLLRAGKTEEALACLAEVVRALSPASPPRQGHIRSNARDEDKTDWQTGGYFVMPDGCWEYLETRRAAVLADLGSLHLARRDYEEALCMFLDGEHWQDAAYIAERVMTTAELRAFVDREVAPLYHWRDSDRSRAMRVAGTQAEDLRHLLARRLAREGRFEEALFYTPAEHRSEMQKLSDALRAGRDPRRSDEARAKALWQAARLMRSHGLELVGTEVGPDCAHADGDVNQGDPVASRTSDPYATILQPSDDEITRALASAPTESSRFHYRFLAANLGWEAAALMPDDSPETAAVLCEAGSWIKAASPKKADRFYKALVRRCGDTALGREADRKRWFPVMATAATLE